MCLNRALNTKNLAHSLNYVYLKLGNNANKSHVQNLPKFWSLARG